MTDTAFLFLKGLLLGFSIAAPVGPIGLLCIRRSLEAGFLPGVAGGLGTAAADAVYAAIAAFGLTAVSSLLLQAQGALAIVGGGALIWLGYVAMTGKPPEAAAEAPVSRSLWPTFASTFVLTMANPATILTFAAIFAGLGLAAVDTTAGAAVLVVGVLLGSLLWWAILSGTVSLLRQRIPATAILWINRASGAALAGFGATLLVGFL
ncbi:MAG: LysE family translocator [Alphaproteobacteria bacterium]|nr:LysE family translocator [Alphaproteobacteria bacterium]